MVGLGFIGGLFEGLGIASVIPLFYAMTGESLAGNDVISNLIARAFSFAHIPTTVPFLLGLIVVLFVLKGVVQFAVRYFTARIIARFEESLRRTLLRRTLAAQWPHLMQQKAGHLEGILLYDVEQASGIFNTITNMVITCTTFLAYIVVAITISWQITVFTLLLGGLLFWAFKPIFYRIRQRSLAASAAQKEANHHVAEHMASAKSIKAMGVEAPVLAGAFGAFARLRKARVSTALYRQSSLAIIEPLGFIVIAVLFLLNYRTPGFSIISFGVIMYLVQRMFGYVNTLSGQVQIINQAYPYLKAAMDWRRRAGMYAETDEGTESFSLEREITFEQVSFGYRSDALVLNGLSFSVPKGQIVGLVGPSGVGKTTVVDLLLRLLSPTQGSIRADGIDIRKIRLHDWRNHIAYMPQDATLLNATIRHNIRFYGEATDEQIEQAARDANIHDMITSLPQGYDSMAGERGVNLSGGQRQRILLARALARNPDILILDEATSSIDHESETLIRTSISNLRSKVTVIMIAHRLSSIMDADSVIILEDGVVREHGNPKELARHEDSQLAKLLAASHIEA